MLVQKLILLTITITAVFISTIGLNQNVFAETEVVFSEDFDDTLTGWTQTLCQIHDANQACNIIQAEFAQPLSSYQPLDPAISEPYWGVVSIADTDPGSCSGAVEARYSKEFVVSNDEEYQVTAVIGVTNGGGTIETATMYIDGIQIFQRSGINGYVDPNTNQKVFFESDAKALNVGTHTIEIGAHSVIACHGEFYGAFDDIEISRIIPLTCGEGTVEVENQCVVDPTITQQIIDLEALVLELRGIIAELEALLGIHAPFTEEECDDIKQTVIQKEADGKKVPSKLLENYETCIDLYGE